MRVLINIPAIKYTGSYVETYNILKILDSISKNEEYYIFISRVARDKLPNLPLNFHLITFPLAEKSWIVHFIFDQIFLPFFILFKKIDVILSYNFVSFLAPRYQILRILQPLCFSQLLLEKSKSQGIKYKIRLLIQRTLILLSIRRANKVIFVSNSLKQDISRFIDLTHNEGKYIVSPIGRYGEVFNKMQICNNQKINSLKNNRLKILYPAFYRFHKNFSVLFEAVPLIKERIKQDFVLILTMELDDLSKKDKKIISDKLTFNDLQSHIVFLGKIDYQEMGCLYKMSNIVVFPSFIEACPNPLPEAMSLGIPIVASDIPVHKEICQDAALYFDVSNAEDLANKVFLLYENKILYNQLVEKGLERVKVFSWYEHGHKIYELFQEGKTK